ncbi:MAG: NUDIX domain-containing protein [bacterium]
MKSFRGPFPYCPFCRTVMGPQEEYGRERPTCSECGYIQYLNPAPAAAVIIRRGEKICLVQRKYPPRQGMWTLPAGFMEYDETIQQTAIREAAEETNLTVAITELFAVYTGRLPPDLPVVLTVFRAEEQTGDLHAGDDAAAAGFFDLDHLPGEIAFGSHRKVLAALREEAADRE